MQILCYLFCYFVKINLLESNLQKVLLFFFYVMFFFMKIKISISNIRKVINIIVYQNLHLIKTPLNCQYFIRLSFIYKFLCFLIYFRQIKFYWKYIIFIAINYQKKFDLHIGQSLWPEVLNHLEIQAEWNFFSQVLHLSFGNLQEAVSIT